MRQPTWGARRRGGQVIAAVEERIAVHRLQRGRELSDDGGDMRPP
jgi:hypothetical protein